MLPSASKAPAGSNRFVAMMPSSGSSTGPTGVEDKSMNMKLTAVYMKVPEGYIAFVEELPGANTQGATLEEARENLQEAVGLVLEANRLLVAESLEGQEVIKEPLPIT